MKAALADRKKVVKALVSLSLTCVKQRVAGIFVERAGALMGLAGTLMG